MASEANLGRAHSGLWADDDGVEYCKAHGTFQCQFCVDLEPIVAALLADVRQEQHEATIMDLWPRLQQSIRTVSMQRIVHPGPPDPQPQGSEANR